MRVLWLRLVIVAIAIYVAVHVITYTSLGHKLIRGVSGSPSLPRDDPLLVGSSGAAAAASRATIPKILHLTYHNKAAIPQKIHDDLRTFAAGYDVRIYDDADCEAMLRSHFTPAVLRRFRGLRGAHKADLLRYCYLLKDGGVYIDVKTKLIMPLDRIIDHSVPGAFYTVLSTVIPDTIYQGILACPPRHPLMLECLMFVVRLPAWVPRIYYHIFTTDMYAAIRRRCGVGKERAPRLRHGWNEEPEEAEADVTAASPARLRYHLFPTMSRFSNQAQGSAYRCEDGLDRYGLCEYVLAGQERSHTQHAHAEGTPLIKLRHADFPWKKRVEGTSSAANRSRPSPA